MTTPTVKVRLSPSGRFVGKPSLLQGPGSIGRVWRKHASGVAQFIPTAVTAAIAALDAVPVDVRPGYVYQLDASYVVATQGLTVSANVLASFRLRNKDTQAWGSWVPLSSEAHVVRGSTTNATQDLLESDSLFGIASTVTCDALELGVIGDASAGFAVLPNHSWLVLKEYVP